MDRPLSGSSTLGSCASASATSHTSHSSSAAPHHVAEARIARASRLPLSTLPSSRPMRLTRSAASRVPRQTSINPGSSAGETTLGSLGSSAGDTVGDVSLDSLRSTGSSGTRALHLLRSLDESFGTPTSAATTSTTSSSASPQHAHARRASGESVRGKRISRPIYVGASNGCEPDWLLEAERSPFWAGPEMGENGTPGSAPSPTTTNASSTLGRIASLRRSVQLSRPSEPPHSPPSCLPLDADPFARPTSALSLRSSERTQSRPGSSLSTHSAAGAAQLLLNKLPAAPRPRLLSATAELSEPAGGLCTPPRDAPRSAHSPAQQPRRSPAQPLPSRFSQSPASRGRGVETLRKLARLRKGSTQVAKGSTAPEGNSGAASLAVPAPPSPSHRRGALSGGLRTMRSAASIGNLRKLLPKSSRAQLAPPLPTAPATGSDASLQDDTSPRPSGSLRWPRRRHASTATVVSGGSAVDGSLPSPLDATTPSAAAARPASPPLPLDKPLPATPSRRRRTSSAAGARTPGGRRRVPSTARAIPVSPPRGSTRALPAPRRLHLLSHRARAGTLLPGSAAPRASAPIRDSWLDISGAGLDAWALAAAPNGRALEEPAASTSAPPQEARAAWWSRSLRLGSRKAPASEAQANSSTTQATTAAARFATLPTLGGRRSEDLLRQPGRAHATVVPRASRSIDLLRSTPGSSSIPVRPAIPSWDVPSLAADKPSAAAPPAAAPPASDYGAPARSASMRAQLSERRAAATRAMSASPPLPTPAAAAERKPWLRPLRLGDASLDGAAPRSATLEGASKMRLDGGPKSAPLARSASLLYRDARSPTPTQALQGGPPATQGAPPTMPPPRVSSIPALVQTAASPPSSLRAQSPLAHNGALLLPLPPASLSALPHPHSLPIPPRTRRSRASTVSSCESRESQDPERQERYERHERHERNDTVASVQTVSSSILYVAEEEIAEVSPSDSTHSARPAPPSESTHSATRPAPSGGSTHSATRPAPPSGPPQEPLPTPPNSAALTIKQEWANPWGSTEGHAARADRGVTPSDWDELGSAHDHARSPRDTSSSLASEATELLSSLLDSFGEASPARHDDDTYLRPHWHDGDSTRRSSTAGESILSYTSTLSSGASDGADLQSLIDGLMDESDGSVHSGSVHHGDSGHSGERSEQSVNSGECSDHDSGERSEPDSASSGFTWPPRRATRGSGRASTLAAAPTPSIRLSPADGGDSLDVANDTLDVAFEMVPSPGMSLPGTPGTPGGTLESPCPPSRVARMGGGAGNGRAVRLRVSDLDLTKRSVDIHASAAPSAASPPSVGPLSMRPPHVDLRVGFARVPQPSFSPELLRELGLESTPDTPSTPTHRRNASAPRAFAAPLDEYTPPQSGEKTSAKPGDMSDKFGSVMQHTSTEHDDTSTNRGEGSMLTSARHGDATSLPHARTSQPCVFRSPPAIIVRPSDSDDGSECQSECLSVSCDSSSAASCRDSMASMASQGSASAASMASHASALASFRDSCRDSLASHGTPPSFRDSTASLASAPSFRDSTTSCGSASLRSCGDSPGVIATARVIANGVASRPAHASLLVWPPTTKASTSERATSAEVASAEPSTAPGASTTTSAAPSGPLAVCEPTSAALGGHSVSPPAVSPPSDLFTSPPSRDAASPPRAHSASLSFASARSASPLFAPATSRDWASPPSRDWASPSFASPLFASPPSNVSAPSQPPSDIFGASQPASLSASLPSRDQASPPGVPPTSLSYASPPPPHLASPPSLHFASPASSPASSRRDSFWSTGGHNTSMSSVWSPDERRRSGTHKLLPVAESPQSCSAKLFPVAEAPDMCKMPRDEASLGNCDNGCDTCDAHSSLSCAEAEALAHRLRFEEAALTAVLHSRQTWPGGGGGLAEYMMEVFQPPRELEQVGVFLVESRAHFRPLRKQRALDVRDVTAPDHLATPRRWRRLSHAAVRYLADECVKGNRGKSDCGDWSDDDCSSSSASSSASSASGELDESSLWDLSARCSTPPQSGARAPPFRYVLVSPSTQSSATSR